MFRSTPRSGKALAVAAGLSMSLALTAWWSLATVSPSFAQPTDGASGFSLNGDATLVNPGNASPTGAEATADPHASGWVDFDLAFPAGLKLRQLTNLSTDYRFVVGSCWAGSPRFTAYVTNGTRSGSVFFYIGPPPNYTGCASGAYTNTGNLATPTSLVDAANLGGSFNEPYSNVQADFGDYTVTHVHLDVDGGAGGNQTVDFDNTRVNEKLVTYEPPPPPPQGLAPQHGVELLGEPVGGTVQVKEPGQTAFNVLTELSLIPVGSTIDTRGGRVHLTAATGGLGSKAPDHSVDFYDGLFKITQKPGINAPATAKLVGKLGCGKKKKKKGGKKASASVAGPVAVVSKRRRRRLWGSGSGNYSTSGGGGTGSVRGTTWLTQDTCKGTKFKVSEGLGITVFDFKKKKKIKLGPGDKYFAAN